MDSEIIPLAQQLRPKNIEDFIGQENIINSAIIKSIINNNIPYSLLFYGPPGCGKTTLANILSNYYPIPTIQLNGVSFSTQTFKKIIKELNNNSILIIIDEIHRMNKLQQDALLPYIENGNIFVIGTTTENPSFEVNNALLSRMNILIFEQLNENDLKKLMDRVLNYININVNDNIKHTMISYSNYDARQLINIIETLRNELSNIKNEEQLMNLLNKKFIHYDKNGENHYNFISAFHKSIRGSDVNASLFYLARMLVAGEDPVYIARRLIRIASEDIGNADPNAINIAINAFNAYKILGSPEGELALAQCTIYLALCPKSIAVYKAYKKSVEDAKKYSHLPVPLKLRNAVTKFNKEQGYAENYKYPPNYNNSIINEKYFPDEMKYRHYYEPVERGFEREMKKRLDYFLSIINKKNN